MLYRWIRDLHLYTGLFVSPFILAFSLSVLFLNHAKIDPNGWTDLRPPQAVRLPAGLDTAQGPAAIPLAKDILSQVGQTGEIGFTRFVRKTRHFTFPVSRPGLQIDVDVDVDAGTAIVSRRRTGILEALAYLHKLPGPHNVNIRGNSIWTRAWWFFADATVYLTLFISVSGLYLWYALKAERRIGLALLGAGAICFFGMVYAVLR